MTEMGMFWRKDMVVCDEMDHCNKDLIYCCIISASTCLHYTLSGALPAIMHILLIQKSLKFSQGLCNIKINAHIIPSLSV